MIQKLLSAFRTITWLLLLGFILIQCTKSETAPPPDESPKEAPPLSEEAKSQTGLIPLDKEEYEKIPIYVSKTYKGGRRAVKTQVDFSAEMPPVGNQGQQGSCNAWASAYAVRSYLHHKETKKPYVFNGNRDDGAVFSPAFVYNQINKGEDKGSSVSEAYILMKNSGVCTMKDMPYKDAWPSYKTQPTASQKQSALNYRIAGFGRTPMTEESLKSVLSDNNVVQVTIKTDPNFHRPSEKVGGEFIWKSFDASSIPGWNGLHAVVLVGFDDSKNAFKIMNSWGNNWANQGFIWMDYGLLNKVVLEAYIPFTGPVLEQLTLYKPVPPKGDPLDHFKNIRITVSDKQGVLADSCLVSYRTGEVFQLKDGAKYADKIDGVFMSSICQVSVITPVTLQGCAVGCGTTQTSKTVIDQKWSVYRKGSFETGATSFNDQSQISSSIWENLKTSVDIDQLTFGSYNTPNDTYSIGTLITSSSSCNADTFETKILRRFVTQDGKKGLMRLTGRGKTGTGWWITFDLKIQK
ncbi:C1 family peptidase [Larkinella humicola]|uniref:C1 family peptidase n=1 Tax=Larkinella humicola TaxID=2607654 RepID=A0A5N1JLM0_9BACT|nr:C1 family peptidase [Larkinella humicola]KAA9357400.1 C1 family peptidase [Larkinella humicola]